MINELGEQLQATFAELIRDVITMIPRIIVALVLVLLAFAVAAIVEKLLRVLLARLRFASLVKKVGADSWLNRFGIHQSLNDFLPRLGYFLLLFLFARTAADALGLSAISAAIGAFLAYLPNIIAAVLILILGGVVARFAGNAVANAASNAGIDFARSLGNLVAGVILFVLAVMALAQLEVDTAFLRLVATAVLAGLALAFGLSFGLGSRDATRNIIAGFYARKTFRIGEEMEVGGEKGILKAITPTQILLQQEDRVVAVANSVLLDGVARQ